MQMDMFQGCSIAATPAKQDGLKGIYDMIGLMRKNWRGQVIFADMYSGAGKNIIDGQNVRGSPISMLEGLLLSVSRMRGIPSGNWAIVFNDIVKGRATESLPQAVAGWQEEKRIAVDPTKLICYTKDMQKFTIPISYKEGSAATLTKEIESLLNQYRGCHVIMAIDPNGPKDAPWNELRSIWDNHGKNAEMIFHISANTLKRVAKARQATNFNFSPMPDHMHGMIKAFRDAGGWIREPLGSDQWTIALLSKYPPEYGWMCQGAKFHKIDSRSGKYIVSRLSLTKKEMAEVAL